MVNEKRKLTTLPLYYIPSLEYFWKLAHADIVILTDHLQYTKRSPVSISPPLLGKDDQLRIPVRHDGKKKPISQKSIDSSAGFYERTLKTLTHTYHNFPYGYYYLPYIEELLSKKAEGLADYLYPWFKLLIKWLHLPVEIILASSCSNPGADERFIIAAAMQSDANIYINIKEVFEKNWVNRKILEKGGMPTMVFPNFPQANIFQSHCHLSILTFIMRFGPEAGFLIKQFR